MEPLSEAAIRGALTSVAGNLAGAALKLGVSRDWLIEHLARRPHLRAFQAGFREELLDDAQTMLRASVFDKEPWAAELVLTTLGQDRGYSLRPDASYPGDRPEPPPTKLDLSRLTPEQQTELEQLLAVIAIPEPDPVPPPPPPEVQRAAAVLATFMGNVSRTAAALGMPREELKDKIERQAVLQAIIANAREELVDHAETVVRLAVTNREKWAIRFVLKTLGRRCGYNAAMPPAPRRNPPSETPGQDLTRLTDEQCDRLTYLLAIAAGTIQTECP